MTHAQELVHAELNYSKRTGEKPVTYVETPPPGRPQRSGIPQPTRVGIHNARLEQEPPNLDRQGFQRIEHTSAVQDFSQPEAIRTLYYPEVEALLKQATGASKVVVFDHTLRLAQPGHTEKGTREHVQGVHNDQTFISGPRRVRDHLPPAEAEQRLRARHAIINVWRPIGGPALTWPLAMCDARSIDHADLIPSDLVYPDKVGEIYGFAPNPAHRWLYYPALQTHEVLLLKIYDSKTDGTARLTAHTSFNDPTSAPDAPPRRSIEVRSLVFWD
ncbi:MAG: hypothetical protein RL701_1170 [Pseudomonadota bacterium]